MMRVGFVGWRGMVGSVLIQRMLEENDFEHIGPGVLLDLERGRQRPSIGKAAGALRDARDAQGLRGPRRHRDLPGR